MKGRVLVVDDELYARRLIEMILERYQYSVQTASSGAEALTLLREREFHAVTCDLIMPGMNGMEFLKRVTTDPQLRRIPVIMITAAGTQEDLERSCQRGAAGALIKPFSERQLIQMLEQVIPPPVST
jgi:CheY-like chemotaxis protein